MIVHNIYTNIIYNITYLIYTFICMIWDSEKNRNLHTIHHLYIKHYNVMYDYIIKYTCYVNSLSFSSII